MRIGIRLPCVCYLSYSFMVIFRNFTNTMNVYRNWVALSLLPVLQFYAHVWKLYQYYEYVKELGCPVFLPLLQFMLMFGNFTYTTNVYR